uniref:Uncharacterized protein n=1 Tax=Haptolina ericina TaxID=156174 RepID=A0A7S3ER20_9EUKA|mmetsp:Transcript_15268/g.34116  ORF Transcript_15268/g.34116 Transcript_15268/m.34116 type:complete len:102 (+) Transcript_15268:92-397(+)
MAILKALQARLHYEGPERDGDGYFIRLKDGDKIGPMSEKEFDRVRFSNEISEVASAWRVAGGTFYKVEFRRKIVWDVHHVLSCKASLGDGAAQLRVARASA